MWFSFEGDSDWKPISTDEVAKILELNEKGEKPNFREKEIPKKENIVVDETINLEGSLNRMESKTPKPKNKKKRYNKNRNKKNDNIKK